MKNTLILITAAGLTVPALLSAQGEADPFAKKPAANLTASADKQPPQLRNLSICYEAFSLPLPAAAELMRNTPLDQDLYKTILAMVHEKKAKQETLSIIRTRSGQLATSASVIETIYPTEWDPAEIPNVVGVQISPQENRQEENPAPAPTPNTTALSQAPIIEEISPLKTAANPTAYDTRNTGHSLEVEATRGQDGTIDIRIAPEHVTLLGRSDWGQDAARAQTPEFQTQRLSTGVSLSPNIPHFLGTISEPPAIQQAKGHVPTVWFAFVTANAVN